jgi:hypothetical protein
VAFSDEVELGTVITRDQEEKPGIHFESHILWCKKACQFTDTLIGCTVKQSGNVETTLG